MWMQIAQASGDKKATLFKWSHAEISESEKLPVNVLLSNTKGGEQAEY